MSLPSDIILFGPRLAIAVGSETASRVFSGLRRAGLLGDPGGDASAERTTMAENAPVPVVQDDPPEAGSAALELEPDLPEVIPNVPQAVGGGFPEPSGKDPGDISNDPSPHHGLNAPVGAPDPTEWPDPYEDREDPRDPPDPDAAPFGEEPHPPVGGTSTSDPHPDADIEAPRTEPPQRDKLDD
jgi:hypothetical protein